MTAATDPRPRVLCVDDDAFMLNILAKTIGVGYEVLTSIGGRRHEPGGLDLENRRHNKRR
jgi:hypothetical protein